jgi:hypothetical protein
MVSILNFVFTILFYVMRWKKQDLTSICFDEFLNKNHWNQIFNFQQLKNPSLFLFHFFFSVLARLYSFSNLSDPSHTLSHIFSLAQSAVRPNRAFSPSTQFPLVIFDLQTLAAAFGLPGCCTALRCVVCLWHHGAVSPPPPLPLKKWPHSITSPSLFLSPVTGDIEVPPPLPPFP